MHTPDPFYANGDPRWPGHVIGGCLPGLERAAMIYQHEAQGADQTITVAIDAHIVTEQGRDDDDGAAGALVPVG